MAFNLKTQQLQPFSLPSTSLFFSFLSFLQQPLSVSVSLSLSIPSMEIPLIDASSIVARLRAPGLIAISIAAFLAFVSLARRTAHLILNRAKNIAVISNQAAASVFSGEWSDTDSEPEPESDSDSDASFSDEESEIDEMETHGDSRGQDGNFDVSWGGSVVKTWEGLGLFGSGLNRSGAIAEGDDDDGTSVIPVVRYWDDTSVRPKWRRRRSFVMMDLW